MLVSVIRFINWSLLSLGCCVKKTLVVCRLPRAMDRHGSSVIFDSGRAILLIISQYGDSFDLFHRLGASHSTGHRFRSVVVSSRLRAGDSVHHFPIPDDSVHLSGQMILLISLISFGNDSIDHSRRPLERVVTMGAVSTDCSPVRITPNYCPEGVVGSIREVGWRVGA